MDNWAILLLTSVLSVSGLAAVWQSRTGRKAPDWRETLAARLADEEAIRVHGKEREPEDAPA